ncbi:MAG: metal ABC transporter permease [Cytophagales bacterium]|nr:metal ABC transporter permease [Cytophagales bacterium]
MDFFFSAVASFWSDPTVRYVLICCLLLSLSSSLTGSFALLRGQALLGDALAHATLPGVCISFLLLAKKDMGLLLLGAFCSSALGMWLWHIVLRYSRLKSDTATAFILAFFFGIGTFLLTWIQGSGMSLQSGLHRFLFGSAASLVGDDVLIFVFTSVLSLLIIILFRRDFILLSFDPNFGRSIGFPIRVMDFILSTLLLISIVIGIQTVGIVLISAMLIIPPSVARFWTYRMGSFLLLSCFVGCFSTLCGVWLSYLGRGMPTGPWIVVTAGFLAFISFFLAPRKGILPRLWSNRRLKRRMRWENLLKVFYHLAERNEDFYSPRHWDTLVDSFTRGEFEGRSLHRKELCKLCLRGWLVENGKDLWSLSPEGKEQAYRIVRRHRLWELYLTEYMHFPIDQVHKNAESMEHLLSPELEARLDKKMGYPKRDPHQTRIPREGSSF